MKKPSNSSSVVLLVHWFWIILLFALTSTFPGSAGILGVPSDKSNSSENLCSNTDCVSFNYPSSKLRVNLKPTELLFIFPSLSQLKQCRICCFANFTPLSMPTTNLSSIHVVISTSPCMVHEWYRHVSVFYVYTSYLLQLPTIHINIPRQLASIHR